MTATAAVATQYLPVCKHDCAFLILDVYSCDNSLMVPRCDLNHVYTHNTSPQKLQLQIEEARKKKQNAPEAVKRILVNDKEIVREQYKCHFASERPIAFPYPLKEKAAFKTHTHFDTPHFLFLKHNVWPIHIVSYTSPKKKEKREEQYLLKVATSLDTETNVTSFHQYRFATQDEWDMVLKALGQFLSQDDDFSVSQLNRFCFEVTTLVCKGFEGIKFHKSRYIPNDDSSSSVESFCYMHFSMQDNSRDQLEARIQNHRISPAESRVMFFLRHCHEEHDYLKPAYEHVKKEQQFSGDASKRFESLESWQGTYIDTFHNLQDYLDAAWEVDEEEEVLASLL